MKLKLIRRWQRLHLPLAEIRRRLAAMSDRDVDEALAASERGVGGPVAHSGDARCGGEGEASGGEGVALPTQAFEDRDVVSSLPFVRIQRSDERGVENVTAVAGNLPAPTRSTWERHSVVADVEVHVRRPLTRDLNRRLERLLQQARDIFDEEV